MIQCLVCGNSSHAICYGFTTTNHGLSNQQQQHTCYSCTNKCAEGVNYDLEKVVQVCIFRRVISILIHDFDKSYTPGTRGGGAQWLKGKLSSLGGGKEYADMWKKAVGQGIVVRGKGGRLLLASEDSGRADTVAWWMSDEAMPQRVEGERARQVE